MHPQDDGYLRCVTDPRSLVPIVMLALGGGIHFLICLVLFWKCSGGREFSNHNETDEDNNKCSCNPTFIKIMKYMIAIIFFLCAASQTALDYYQFSELSKGIEAGSWKSYQCAVFVFTNSPNALHAVAAVFAFATAIILSKFDKNSRMAIMIFVGGEILVGIIVTPFFASVFTHLIAGLFTYGWIAIFVFALSFFILYKMNTASLEHRKSSWTLFIGVAISMILMVLLIVVTNNTQLKLYDGVPYIEALKRTLDERKVVEYFDSLKEFDQYFTFIWLLV
mmetsp:Transcript_5973/g.5200  ORF Transcript_5973/g.5200 Transcript_5973/m.5200 type:complete len:279 (+) Transcript_5973:31-867(+)